ncbi:MAG TPA: tRNA preQ1(34) S-adenosylmethionine ribosyltransferase-isomerase QueA [Candidatus Baltobacteraceae bacterium]|nr:tRNA preQ1(34) S-adenosylmethionine ribosyltransferase-isomerase QueA [Candidatus Baltobacteraceae bacterium]
MSASRPPAGPRDVAAYDYALPPELIAHEPAARRDASRLLVPGRDGSLRDLVFAEFPSVLRAGDVLVLNETRVVRARLPALREGGARAEVLLLRPRGGGAFDPSAREWLALVRPGRKLRARARLTIGATVATIVDVLPDGPRVLRFDDGVDVGALLERHGEVPLPPYVGEGDPARGERYQTVFARVPGSVAAPTASLHFTPEILEALRARGVVLTPLVLDVGIGTFRPMSGATIDEHVMHAERYAIPEQTANAVRAARAEGRRVIAAGTTVLRALEGAALRDGEVRAGEDETELFVTPGFRFRVVDALLTNFHLPRSTLLVLVAAFAGYAATREAYRTAIERRYRFFSFGDAMFVERSATP